MRRPGHRSLMSNQMASLATGMIPPATAAEADSQGTPVRIPGGKKLPRGVLPEDCQASGDRLPPLPRVLTSKGERITLKWDKDCTIKVESESQGHAVEGARYALRWRQKRFAVYPFSEWGVPVAVFSYKEYDQAAAKLLSLEAENNEQQKRKGSPTDAGASKKHKEAHSEDSGSSSGDSSASDLSAEHQVVSSTLIRALRNELPVGKQAAAAAVRLLSQKANKLQVALTQHEQSPQRKQEERRRDPLYQFIFNDPELRKIMKEEVQAIMAETAQSTWQETLDTLVTDLRQVTHKAQIAQEYVNAFRSLDKTFRHMERLRQAPGLESLAMAAAPDSALS